MVLECLLANFIKKIRPSKGKKIILVSHTAGTDGAPHLVLALSKCLHGLGFQVAIVILKGGPMREAFSQWGELYDLSNDNPCGAKARYLAWQLLWRGYRVAICNTVLSGSFLSCLARVGMTCVALIHELSGILNYDDRERGCDRPARLIVQYASSIVFPAQQVADAFYHNISVLQEKKVIRPQGLLKKNAYQGKKEIARDILRKTLGLEKDAKIILAMGYGQYRKGVDLFIIMALKALETHPALYFVWVGDIDERMKMVAEELLAKAPDKDHIVFLGYQSDVDYCFAGADVFVLPSREDPFPSVVLQSLDMGVPVVGFLGAGGFTLLLEKGCGILVPFENTTLFAEAVVYLIESPEESTKRGQTGAAIIAESYLFADYVDALLDLGFARH